jgi:hypothetical protein
MGTFAYLCLSKVRPTYPNISMSSLLTTVAITRLQLLHGAMDRIGADAKAALAWLDHSTNQAVSPAASRIRLEGEKETYKTWAEVEEFMLPRPLLSMEDTVSTENTESTEKFEEPKRSIAELYTDDNSEIGSPVSRQTAEERDTFTAGDFPKQSPRLFTPSASPRIEPPKKEKVLQPIGTGRPSHRKTDSNVSSVSATSTARPLSRQIGDEVPDSLRQFFNHIMWRINEDKSTTSNINSYILLTNDNAKQIVAQRFGIRVKRLEQMRDIIEREQAESQTGLMISNANGLLSEIHQSPSLAPAAPITERNNDEEAQASESSATDCQTPDDDDEVLIRPKALPKAPQAMKKQPQSPGKQPQLFDPNSFGRGHSHSTRGGSGHHRGGRSSGPFGSPRGGTSHSPRFSDRPTSAGRGALYTPRRGGAQPHHGPQPAPLDLSKPIDPDTFTRATAGGQNGRTRGGGRRQLWEPS